MAKKSPKSYWNYRIVIEQEPDLVNRGKFIEFVSIRDVYYDDDQPKGYGAEAQSPQGETAEDLINDITLMLEALHKRPLFVSKDGKLHEQNYAAGDLLAIKNFFKVVNPKKPPMRKYDYDSEELMKKFKEYSFGQFSDSTAKKAILNSNTKQMYVLEEKKRELEHEIEKARMQRDTQAEIEMINAYKKFEKETKGFKKYPF